MGCPCRQPFCIVITDFSELIITNFQRHKIFVAQAGVQPYRREPALRELARQLTDASSVDVVIVCGKKRLTAHGSILAARIPSFEQMQGPRTDTTPTRWVVPNASLSEVEAFLRYVYTSELRDPDDVMGLMDLCQRFQVQDGYERCLQYCQRHVSPALAVRWLVEGHRRGLRDLTEWLRPYVTQHWDDIRQCAPQSFNLMQPYPELLEATIPEHRRLRRR
eukprot:EG_transcript_17154